MQEPQRHEMQLVMTHASGAEEWCCLVCGRRFVMQWPPAYERVIIEAGDEAAIHSGGKGQAQLNMSIEVHSAMIATPEDPWSDWLKDVYLGNE